MNLLTKELFDEALTRSIGFIQKDYERLKELEKEYEKLKLFLNIISERDYLLAKHIITIELTDHALMSCKNFKDAIRQAMYDFPAEQNDE
jgi:hypothetical protein